MAIREGSRPGGRSARVQESVHQAVRDLLAEHGSPNFTVPIIAARAGVTASTIYRRWGDLSQLLADVAVERLRPDGEPLDTGHVEADLRAWAEQFFEEMTSAPGRAMVRDVMACAAQGGWQSQCSSYTQTQIQIILDRAARRGERAPDLELIMDRFVAPVMYRILFQSKPLTLEGARTLIDSCLSERKAT
ncbi:TetR/AcrR family transcriptional regulator [Castellaniella sp. FW104-16D08]|uniref:TetR/AcrR family transcriptional regulator n=1 Tax=unclassified Castellaniella TaxID=2617606 RepID=UPI00331474B2